MANYNQLRVLNDTQANAIKALGNGLAVAELVKVYWPSPTGAKVYAWWDLLNDTTFAASDLSTWLDGAPLIPAFVAQDEQKVERFHEIPRTAQIGDDVVRMRFTNHDGAFEALCATHNAGVKVEIFYYFPQVGDGLAVHWFSGHLRTPDNVDKDFVDISITEGLRSADLQLPNRVHASQCTWAAQFGGQFDPLLDGNPCDYDRHVSGGTRGLLNGAVPFTECDGSKANCDARMGDLLSYGGFDAVTDTSYIGSGSNTTVSETKGQTTRMKEPVGVAYGEGWHNNLPLLDYAKEYNTAHPDEGTIRTLVEISEGPIESVTEFELMDEPLPRTDGLGLEVKLGTQQQTATTYSENVLNYNRLAHARADKNPWNPNGVQPSSIVAKCKFKGRNTIRVYTDETTYTETYSNKRAWVMFDLMRDTTYGHREAVERHHIPDLIRWAATNDTFGGIVQGKSAQQQITDICLGGKRFLPFMHKDANQDLAQWRWLGIEEYDLEDADIPEFTDTGANRNILKDGRGLSRIKVSRRDDDKIPNEWTLTFNDAEHKSLERPLLFFDKDAQKRAGEVYGDGSLRKVPDTETAFGVTSEPAARDVGFYLLDYGRFYSGGIKNNGTVEFVTSHLFHPEALDLHQNKVIKITSDKLDNLKDPEGNVFTHFIVTALQTTARGELVVSCQAYAALRATEVPTLCNDAFVPTPPYGALKAGDNISLIYMFDTVANPFTLEGWFKFNPKVPIGGPGAYGSHPTIQTIVSSGDDAPAHEFPPDGWLLGIDETDNKIFVVCDNGTIEKGSTLEHDTWYHFALTFAAGSGAARKLYLNGALDAETTGNQHDLSAFNQPFIFFTNCNTGLLYDYYGGLATGGMTGFNAFTRVLTADEVLARYGERSFIPGDTADWWACWPFEDPTDTGPSPPYPSSTDLSPNCREITQGFGVSFLAASSAPGLSLYPNGYKVNTGGGGTNVAFADSRLVLSDIIFRDENLEAGQPGFYWGVAADNTTDAWNGAALYVDRGAGYVEIDSTTTAATIGTADDALAFAGTSVDVTLAPGQTLPSSGEILLGAEILNYGSATLGSGTTYTLGTLTNRGKYGTTAGRSTHSIGEYFALLTDAMRFVVAPSSEIGQTRNYKAVTDGNDVADATPVSFTLDAPNFQLETPSDFNGTTTAQSNAITWTWTPISDANISLNGVVYEVHSTNTGSDLLWSGSASSWTENVATSGTVTRYFRARSNYDTGAWVSDSTAITVQPLGTSLLSSNNTWTGTNAFDKTVRHKVITLTDAATITMDASVGNHFYCAITAARTLGIPSNAPATGYTQAILVKLKNSSGGSVTPLLTTTGTGCWRYGATVLALPAISDGKTLEFTAAWHDADAKWDVTGYSVDF